MYCRPGILRTPRRQSDCSAVLTAIMRVKGFGGDLSWQSAVGRLQLVGHTVLVFRIFLLVGHGYVAVTANIAITSDQRQIIFFIVEGGLEIFIFRPCTTINEYVSNACNLHD